MNVNDELLDFEAAGSLAEERADWAWLDKVHCGDCLTLMGKMPAASIGLIVTSPPYNLRNSTGNGLKDGRGGKWPRAELIHGYQGHADDLPADVYIQWQRACLTAMMRLLREDGAIFYNHKWRVQGGLLQDRSEIVKGFPVRQIIIWKRDGGINFNPGYFLPTYEVIYLIAQARVSPSTEGERHRRCLAHSPREPEPSPRAFPVELAQRCIQATNVETVLDPFLGSGTTAIAAQACDRKWIGIEASPNYCEWPRTDCRESIANECRQRTSRTLRRRDRWPRNCLIGAGSMTSEHASRGPGS